MKEWKYQAELRCKACEKMTMHFFGEGRWFCIRCNAASALSEALSDIADAAARRMQREAREVINPANPADSTAGR